MPRKNDPGVAAYALPLLQDTLNSLLKEKDGVLAAKDIEYLHRMRVASRRMRSCLWLFKGLFPKRAHAALRRETKAITRVLGKARDVDTHVRFLRSAGRNSPGSPALDAALKKERAKLQEKIALRLGLLDGPGLSAMIRQARKSPKASLPSLLGKKLLARLETLQGFNRSCRNAGNIPCLHRMRIAAKHLRYALEHSRPYYGPSLDTFIREAKKLHDTLGDVHNFHLWAKQARASGIPGLSPFTRACAQRERRAYRKFLAAWERQQKLGIWETLEERL